MPILHNYSQFNGRHWETGSVHNVLAYQGIEVPETGQPISEAMLMGISGGAAFGYFIFEYMGSDPYVSLLSRNTFNPLDTLLERLAIPQDLFHTTDASKAGSGCWLPAAECLQRWQEPGTSKGYLDGLEHFHPIRWMIENCMLISWMRPH